MVQIFRSNQINKLSLTKIIFEKNSNGNYRMALPNPPPPLFNLLITLPLHSTSNFPPLPPSRATLPNYDLFADVYVNILMAAQHATTTIPLVSSTLVRPSRGQPGSGKKG